MALADWGWSEDWADKLLALGDEPGNPARVSNQERTLWTIQTERGPHLAPMPSAGLPDDAPAVGDWVVTVPGDAESDPHSMRSVLPGAPSSHVRQWGNVPKNRSSPPTWIESGFSTGLDVELNARRLERYLAVSWESGAQPEIVLSKADIAVDLDQARRVAAEVRFGVPVRVVGTMGPPGCQELEDSLVAGIHESGLSGRPVCVHSSLRSFGHADPECE